MMRFYRPETKTMHYTVQWLIQFLISSSSIFVWCHQHRTSPSKPNIDKYVLNFQPLSLRTSSHIMTDHLLVILFKSKCQSQSSLLKYYTIWSKYTIASAVRSHTLGTHGQKAKEKKTAFSLNHIYCTIANAYRPIKIKNVQRFDNSSLSFHMENFYSNKWMVIQLPSSHKNHSSNWPLISCTYKSNDEPLNNEGGTLFCTRNCRDSLTQPEKGTITVRTQIKYECFSFTNSKLV